MEVYENGTYVSDVLNRGFFYNTMYLHRGVMKIVINIELF